ncbi:MAG: AlwI family type II restriction endonuclease [Flavobacteriales bacterium]
MPNVWNVGNTTVRNANRIENALRVFFEEGLSGNVLDNDGQRRLHRILRDREILEFDGDPSDWNGRKWRSAFYQLGFISYETYRIGDDVLSVGDFFHQIGVENVESPYQVTPAGHRLISAESIPQIEDIYTRQFCCWELPSAIERGPYPDGRMKPFILFLQVVRLLQVQGELGLNKLETGLFIQPFRNHTAELPGEIVARILAFRAGLAAQGTRQLERNFIRDTKEEVRQEIQGPAANTFVGDYSDTSFRYFLLTGLFVRRGNRLQVRASKIGFVDSLLAGEPQFQHEENPEDYFSQFYRNTYPLPSDDAVFAIEEMTHLMEDLPEENELRVAAEALTAESEPEEIERIRYDLIEHEARGREITFAEQQSTEDAVSEILQYLNVLDGRHITDAPEVPDRPAYLEWAVWRAFLAIDSIVNPIHESRRFPVDADFFPRNTAPGRGSDLIIEFESLVLVVEVTLTLSSRQLAVESEPVRRHTADYKELYPEKDVYCLFVAPDVDNNVAESFRIGVWYRDNQEEFLNIVPMTLRDFITAFESMTERAITIEEFRNLMDRCLVSRNVRAPQWKAQITSEVDRWRDTRTA